MKQTLPIVKKIVKALDDKKAIDIRVIKIEDLTTLAEYFVICNGTSTTQIKTLADEVEVMMTEQGEKIIHREGYSAGNWILLDYGFIIVHVFHKDMREYYNLERLWADGEMIEISTFLK